MRRTIIGFLFVLFTSAPIQAVTLEEVIDLTKAGLGEEVLLALIEVDGGVFDVDSATLTRLKRAGVSERVIVAMVRSGRVRVPVAPEPQPLADVVAGQTVPEVVYVTQPARSFARWRYPIRSMSQFQSAAAAGTTATPTHTIACL